MIFTFYSYKGGVGRSMALANIAELLYEHGRQVLMIDWDLDSPGLESFFPQIRQKAKENRGLLDMLWQYKIAIADEDFPKKTRFKITDQSLSSFYKESLSNAVFSRLINLKDEEFSTEQAFVQAVKHAIGETDTNTLQSILKHSIQWQIGDIHEYLVDVYPPSDSENGGFLKLLSAGKRDAFFFEKYAEVFNSFEWKDLYENWADEGYLDWLRRLAESVAPIILIDSRNGINEMSKGCAYRMADVVVAFVSSSEQSIEGTQKVIEQLQSSELDLSRQGRTPIEVVVAPARVEQTELLARNRFEKRFKEMFDELLPETWKQEHRSFWELHIPYIPFYAFEELVAIREKRENRGLHAQELVDAYKRIWEAMQAKAATLQECPRKWRKQTGKVLIIEDIVTWQNLLKEIVETKVGESWEIASDLNTAKKLLDDNDYTLIILNLNLSTGGLENGIQYGGMDILDLLNAEKRQIPVLLILSAPTIQRDVFERYTRVKDVFFKGAGGELARTLAESIRKYTPNR